MKITKLRIRGLFGLKEFDSDGKSIELTGQKGAGKSAVIDAIKYALSNRSDREFILTRGENEGEVLIETDSGIRVNRKVRTGKADYKSIKQAGQKDEKTEAFLREIFTELQLNPIEFARMDVKEQNRIILDLIDFKWDLNWIKEQFGEIPRDVNYEQNILCVLHDIQADEGYYFLTRQDINREARNKQAFIEEIGAALPKGYNAAQWEKVNLAELYKQIETIRNRNEWIEKAKRSVANRDNKIRGFQADFEIEKAAIEKETSSTRNSLEKQIVEMENKIREYRKELETLEEKKISKLALARQTMETKSAEYDGEVKQYEDMAKETPMDFSELQKEAEHTERMKAFINEYRRMVGLQDDVKRLKQESDNITAKIEKARSLPGEILASVKIPIDGLTIKDGMPLINGLPVSNLSDGEKLDLCIRIAVQREGALKMLLLDGIERLDTKSRDDIYRLLKNKGVQFIASRTTDDDKLTVVEL
jgi:DNA repair exonuclease SbcCD ATPase subunit